MVADAPNPDGPHLHLFRPHLLAQARADAARTGSTREVWCVICRGVTTIGADPAPRDRCGDGEPAGDFEPVAPQRHHGAARGPRQEVRGLVVVLAPTTARDLVRLRVGDVVVFASHASGHAEALRAAAARGDHVRADAERVGGDLYVRAVSAL